MAGCLVLGPVIAAVALLPEAARLPGLIARFFAVVAVASGLTLFAGGTGYFALMLLAGGRPMRQLSAAGHRLVVDRGVEHEVSPALHSTLLALEGGLASYGWWALCVCLSCAALAWVAVRATLAAQPAAAADRRRGG